MIDRVRKIEIFLRAAEARSFAKAAAVLAITPSAVSHAIADLERELGASLFHRTTRHLRLTEEGEDVYRRGAEIRDRLTELESSVVVRRGRLTGTLRVGLSANLNRYIVGPGLAQFLARHPGLRLECSVITEPSEMHAEGVDVLLRVTDPPDSSLLAKKLGELRFGVYASPAYLDAAGVPAHPEDLAAHRCVVHHPRVMTRPQDEWIFERRGERRVVKVTPVLSTNDREALIAAVVGGAGIMRIGMFDPTLITSGRLRKLLPEWTCPGGQAVYALYRRTARLAPKVAAFVGYAEEAFASFDPHELTIMHTDGRRVGPRRHGGRQ